MGKLGWFAMGGLLVLFGCGAAAKFQYKYFVLEAKDYRGTLKGPQPKDDLSLELCKPSQGKAGPCITVLKDEFLRIKSDYLNISQQLQDCQRGQ